jgi:flagellar basal-body rod modification protein FlgD
MIATGADLELQSLALPRTAAADATKELGQEDFLALMMTQIQNQDPFEPMESGQFLAQMAQFSTVSGIGEISESVAALSEALLANQAMQASSMIGRSVLVESAQGVLQGNEPMRGALEMPAGTESATVRITDASGQLVRELDVDAQGGALANFAWDGVTTRGELAPAGVYQIQASSRSGGGDISLTSYLQVKVSSVALDAGGVGSVITTDDGQQLRFSQVRAVM